MNSHHVKGAMHSVKGKLKETTGHVLRNRSLVTEGKVQQLKGIVHFGYGNIKDSVSHLRSNVRKIIA
ncbi:MAG: CsbD family protein [Granulicella sp.]